MKIDQLTKLKEWLLEMRNLLRLSHRDISTLLKEKDDQHFLLGQILLSQQTLKESIKNIQHAEFKVFSQWGDDGIIHYLTSHIPIKNKTFVEFGVEDYMESNTRFLLMNSNWSGLVLDGSSSNVAKIKTQDFYWKFDLKAKSAFITAENINNLIKEEGIESEIGLLHVDIDGNDYWVWKAITVIDPVIVIVEYNSVFGKERSITVPYKPDFLRSEEHYSMLYAGASLAALVQLANDKGYAFIGSNSAGNNAYFVKRSHLSGLTELTVAAGYVESKFSESRNSNGKLTFIRGKSRIEEIKGMPVFNTKTNKIEKI